MPRLTLEFNLDYYTEVQDLSYLTNSLSQTSPRYTALNLAITSLMEDYPLVGFETLAVEDKKSMLKLTHTIDRATGYVFVPKQESKYLPDGAVDTSEGEKSLRPNAYALFSSAAGEMQYDVRDVQERWIDAREEWDAYEKRQWREEAERARQQQQGPPS